MKALVRNTLVAAAVGALGLLALPASAQAAPPTMTVSPTTLTFGTTFTVSGDGCVDPETQSGDGLTVLVEGRSLGTPSPEDPQGKFLGLADVAADGTWIFEYAAPLESPSFTPTEGFSRNIIGTCGSVDPPNTVFVYPEVPVQFVLPEPTTTTTVVTTTSTSLPTGTGPAPAVPVRGAATFTG